jgi:hypothetical protein
MADLEEDYPKGAGKQSDEDMVAILMTEKVAREYERTFLLPRRLDLAGPLLFTEDDVPTYIIGIQTKETT